MTLFVLKSKRQPRYDGDEVAGEYIVTKKRGHTSPDIEDAFVYNHRMCHDYTPIPREPQSYYGPWYQVRQLLKLTTEELDAIQLELIRVKIVPDTE